MTVRTEEGAGNNGFNSKNESSGASTYNGTTKEEISSETDPDSPGKLLTTTVLTEKFVSHTEEEMLNEVKIGGANNGSSDFRVNAEIVIRGNSTIDSNVDAVKTTNPDGVVEEEGRRETIRSARDRQDSTVSVEGSMGGGGYGMDGTFEMAVTSIDQTVTTQHFITVNGVFTRRDYTEDLLTANNVSMSMSAGGNGFEFSFSQSAGNQFTQFKTGSLTQERVTGEKRGGNSNSFSITVDVNPNYVYHVTSRGRSTYSNEFDYTRYFDENGNVIEGNAGVKLHAYNAATTGFATTFDSRTGDTYTEKSDSQAERTNDNTIDGEKNGLITTTDSDGNIDITTMEHEPYTEIVDDNWNGPQEQPFLLPNPAAAGLMPGNFFGQGLFPFGNSLFGAGFGSSSGRAPRTNLPPIATGTERDGTYWEMYDNGTIWIHRIYDKEGGKLVQETWGRHTQSLPDLLAIYKDFLDNREKYTDIDLAFSDVHELMDHLNQKKSNIPEEFDKKADLKRRILNLQGLLAFNENQYTGYSRTILEKRLRDLAFEYAREGGDVSQLNITDALGNPLFGTIKIEIGGQTLTITNDKSYFKKNINQAHLLYIEGISLTNIPDYLKMILRGAELNNEIAELNEQIQRFQFPLPNLPSLKVSFPGLQELIDERDLLAGEKYRLEIEFLGKQYDKVILGTRGGPKTV